MAAGKRGPGSVWFLANGYNLIAQRLKSLTGDFEQLTERVDGVGETAAVNSPIGVGQVMVDQEGGFYDTSSGGPHAALATPDSTVGGTPRVVCVGFAGMTIGERFYGYEGVYETAYKVLAQLAALTKANVKFLVSGQFDHGTILSALAAKVADWNTKTDGASVDYSLDPSQRVIPITSATKANPCVVTTPIPHGLTTGQVIVIASNTLAGPAINGEQTVTVLTTTTFSVAVNTSASSGAGTGGTFVLGSTVNGGVGFSQVTAASGFTNYVAKVRHSTDDSTYADLITFADNVIAPFAERATVAGTVRRYLCWDGNITGSGSITAFGGFARS